MLYSVIISDFGAAFERFGKNALIKINHAEFAFIYHFAISLYIHRFTRIKRPFGIICILVFFQKIFGVIIIYIRILRPHINPLYVREFFFYFGNKLIANAVNLTLVAEKKGVSIFRRNKIFNNSL